MICEIPIQPKAKTNSLSTYAIVLVSSDWKDQFKRVFISSFT